MIPFKEFTVLFSGFLITLSVYHFLLYFQHKDKVYLYYSLYTFLIFTANYPNTENSAFLDATNDNDPYMQLLIIPREWIYNTLYLMFAKALVELHIYKKNWNKVLNISMFVFFISLFILVIYAVLTKNYYVVGFAFSYFFSPVIAVLALISFYILYGLKTPLKYYVLIGSFIYLVTAEYAFFFASGYKMVTIIFSIGVIIENILFSLALGHKQKLILEEKNVSQLKLIGQLKENENLRDKVQDQLVQDLILFKEKAKNEKLLTLKEKWSKEIAELKITSLRSQMNPHFIFNSLNSIKMYIINNEKENAVYYLNKFSKLIRKILSSTQEKEISLADEIETMELYVNIENIRFNNEINFVLEIEENLNLDTIKIPALILQPFIENAIWHGLASKKEDKKLFIMVKKSGLSHLNISIADNGIGRKKSAKIKEKKIYKSESLGIKLTEERLSNFAKEHNGNYSIIFTDLYHDNTNSPGTKVVLKVPLTKVSPL
ncbi:histidine kinase [Tamlana sp. 2_MG-2023]|uniref:histidine kinase n=1 Tax=unclassified Tamlana TaxID=2614803 RepID=UPI0026E24CFF|nr:MULTISPECIES: histidine kinase [unclassified Tamlana]MDO6758898.1 histidine kinase [Tamlana sp. 2_MG-2023]MDO6789597.1 histidine kinase [Tamlana sp. 1_MG-2023]